MAANLLHSMSHFVELIDALLDRCNPKCIVEIGSEYGDSTRALASHAKQNAAMLHVIDPRPKIDPDIALKDFDGAYKFHRKKSVDALPGIAGDMFVIDGDHNYWTVFTELRLIYEHNPRAWVVLHDVGFPWARRDLYYDPEEIPIAHRHPYSHEHGVDLKTDEIRHRSGFWGAGEYAIALESDTPKNGVLTAVEDFLADKVNLRYGSIPLIFGMGVIVPEHHEKFVAELLRPYQGLLCAALERNRLDLYSDYLDLTHKLHGTFVRRWANRLMDRLGV